jgi:hypothetical protein
VRIKLTLAGASALLALAGCGSEDPPETPAACLAPAPAYLEALAAAPGDVRLEGETPISSCVVADQPTGTLQTVGQSVIATATELNADARRSGNRQTIVELGYLVGAVQEGAAATGGIHRDLVLRLDAAARFTGAGGEPFGAGFERAFGEGYAAGQATG